MDPLEDPNLLPSQAFTTAACLLEMVDRRVVVSLRDGRRLYGVLRSFDQFANLVIQDTTERIFHPQSKVYGQKVHGAYIVRGENVALVGEIDQQSQLPTDAEMPPGYSEISFEEAEKMLEAQVEQLRAADKHSTSVLRTRGFEKEWLADNLY